jgi:hypothetical protein
VRKRPTIKGQTARAVFIKPAGPADRHKSFFTDIFNNGHGEKLRLCVWTTLFGRLEIIVQTTDIQYIKIVIYGNLYAHPLRTYYMQ